MDGTIQRVTLLSTLAIITDERLDHYRTVTDLFQDIRNAGSQDAWERVTFSVDPDPRIPDLCPLGRQTRGAASSS